MTIQQNRPLDRGRVKVVFVHISVCTLMQVLRHHKLSPRDIADGRSEDEVVGNLIAMMDK